MFNQANYNYERMQGTGFCHAMVPVINKLYPDNQGKRAELMQNHMQFFNTEPQWGACIIGLTAALEEKRAQGSEEITGIPSHPLNPVLWDRWQASEIPLTEAW